MSGSLREVAGEMSNFVSSHHMKSVLVNPHVELMDVYKTNLRKMSDNMRKLKKRYEKSHENARKAVIALEKKYLQT